MSIWAAACSVPGTAELPASIFVTANWGAVKELSAMSLPARVSLSNWVAFMVTLQPTPVPVGSLMEKSSNPKPVSVWLAPIRVPVSVPATRACEMFREPLLSVACDSVSAANAAPVTMVNATTVSASASATRPVCCPILCFIWTASLCDTCVANCGLNLSR